MLPVLIAASRKLSSARVNSFDSGCVSNNRLKVASNPSRVARSSSAGEKPN